MSGAYMGRRLTRLIVVGVVLALCPRSSMIHAADLITLVSFDGANGDFPIGGLIADDAGNLYGTAYQGGANYGPTASSGRHGYGTVFRLDTTGALTTIVSFDENGCRPSARLTADADGNLCGTTECGGATGCGTVFKLNPATGVLTSLASFDRANGRQPYAGLTADADGHLFGTTLYGGAHNRGTVFKVDPATGVITTLVSFDGANGRHPYAGLTVDAAGKLYGTTQMGGVNDEGTVFKLDPFTGNLTTLVSFNRANGSHPYAGLTAAANGNFYGTTSSGGAERGGTVFKLNPITNDLTTLVSFDGTNGSMPYAGLITDAVGNLYGTTCYGGTNGVGTVFKLDPATGDLTTLVAFDGANGREPHAGLTPDAAGNLYGTTTQGGARVEDTVGGTVFKLTETGFIVDVPKSETGEAAKRSGVAPASKR